MTEDIWQRDKNGRIILNKDGTKRKKAGRPKGTKANQSAKYRERVTAKYVREMKRTFDIYGEQAMADVAQKHPDKFLQLMSQLIPKQAEVKTEDVTERKEIGTIELANRIAGIIATGAEEADRGTGDGQSADMDTDTGATDGSLLH